MPPPWVADRSDLTAEFSHLALTPEMALDLVEDERDREQIEAYMASGKTLWSRDLDLLADVAEDRDGGARPRRSAQPRRQLRSSP